MESKIVLDFSKNLALLDPNMSADTYMSVTADGTALDGYLEVFNSLLIFTPDTPFPYDSNISVTLNQTVTDLYAQEYDLAQGSSWSFRTKTQQAAVDQNNSGYKFFDTVSGTTTSYQIKTLSNSAQKSKVVVATQNGIDLYDVYYGTYPTEPVLSYRYSYTTNTQINSLATYNGEYLYASLVDGRLLSLRDTNTSLTLINSIDTTQNIHKLRTLSNGDLAAVGPEYGLGLYTIAQDGTLLQKQYSEANNTTYLDVVDATGYDMVAGIELTKLYVADYQGGVDIYDENGTFLSRTDLNSSVKMIIDDDGPQRVLAVGSSGLIQGVGLDGLIFDYVKTELLAMPQDAQISVIPDPYGYGSSYIYYSFGYSGIFVALGDYVQTYIETNSNVIATTMVSNDVYQAFLVTLDQDGSLKVLNGVQDAYGPQIAITSPYDGEIINADANITIGFFDTYLDYENISKTELSFMDTNTSTAVAYNLTIVSDAELGYKYNIDPDQNLTTGHSYMIKVSGSITDMIGNQFNNGQDYNLSFSVN